MEKTTHLIENWEEQLINVLEDIARKFRSKDYKIINEVNIGDYIRDGFLEQYPNSSMEVWPETTWFEKIANSGYYVDRAIMDTSKTKFIYSDDAGIEKNIEVKKFNKQFFHDDLAIAIELKYLREKNCPYDKVVDDYKKIHKIQEALDYRFKRGLYKVLNSRTWRGFVVCGCETEEIYSSMVQRFKMLIESIPATAQQKVFVFGPNKSEFIC